MTGPLKLKFADVSLDVFKEYLKLLHPKYHSGCCVDVEKEFPKEIYQQPYYFDDTLMKEKTHKYFLDTDGELSRIQW